MSTITKRRGIFVADKGYMDSGSWKCDLSPTGAHHWIIAKAKSGKDMTCKYCHNIRHLDEDLVVPIYGNRSKN